MEATAELPLPAGLRARTFPAKLWRLLNSPRVRSLRWDSRARGLLVHRSLFERELLSPGGAQGPAPGTFRATQFRSFVRQLYRYGFHKVPGRTGVAAAGDAGAWLHYSNPWFRRDRPDLLLRIRRRTAANRQRRAAGREGRCPRPCGSRQLPRARPLLPGGRDGHSRFTALPGERPPLPPGRPPSAFLPLHRERGPDGRELRCPRPGRFQQLPRERPPLARRPPCGFHLLHRARPGPARREGPSRFQELYGVQPPPLDREVLRVQPCSFPQLQGEQQPPACRPPAAPGTSAPSAPAGSAGCAASPASSSVQSAPVKEESPPLDLGLEVEKMIREIRSSLSEKSPASSASSSAQSAPAEEESPPLDLGLEVEKMIREIRSSLPERSPSAQGNLNVAPEPSGEDTLNRAAAEEASSGTESCRNSSPEPEEPDPV
ncbi:cleavage and polyadenylation specificity factor subunit 6-like [Prinia subflava]|uniref:cleavage and polyadenylation specificity factor subunit 6-like n=1 Tax=Prinia subflava TaxID=208062 RepID=UPI002FE16834